jgi:hypothetical protein
MNYTKHTREVIASNLLFYPSQRSRIRSILISFVNELAMLAALCRHIKVAQLGVTTIQVLGGLVTRVVFVHDRGFALLGLILHLPGLLPLCVFSPIRPRFGQLIVAFLTLL